MVLHLMNPSSEKVLDILVNDLQRKIVELADGCLPTKEEYIKAKGISETIGILNSRFQRGYETNIERIIDYSKRPMLKTDPSPFPITWKVI